MKTKADDKYSSRSPSKKKYWRSKISGGVKKFSSPGQTQKMNRPSSKRRSNERDGERIAPPKPVNVGDSITISQQFLEESMDISVLTMPKELMMEEDLEHDDEDDDDHIDLNEKDYVEAIENQLLSKSASSDRMSAYASRLLHEGRLYTDEGELVSVGSSPLSPPPPPGTPSQSPHANNSNKTTQRKHNDPPGIESMELNNGGQGKRSDPPVYDEDIIDFDEVLGDGRQGATPQNKNKSVTFSLPPPNYRSAPPFMGPPLDFYYSLERNESDTQPVWSSSPLVPPIMELWSSVECVDSGPIFETDNDLLGEKKNPFHVSEIWLDVCAESETKEKSIAAKASVYVSLESFSKKASIDQSLEKPVSTKASAYAPQDKEYSLTEATPIQMTSTAAAERISLDEAATPQGYDDCSSEMRVNDNTNVEDSPDDEVDFDTPHDEVDSPHDEVDSPDLEYFDEILNCSGDVDDSIFSDQQQQEDEPGGTQSFETNDVNNRHRSSWRSAYNMTYKPPPPHLSFDDPARYLGAEMLHIRFRAAASIQACARAHLQREQYHKLLRSTLIIQPFIKSFLFRQRLSTQIKLKRSYPPLKWRRRMVDNA
jgi:hypothetical protein